MQEKLQGITSRLVTIEQKDVSSNITRSLVPVNIPTNQETRPQENRINNEKNRHQIPFHSSKMKVPGFDESDRMGSISKMIKFFTFHNILED